MRPTHHRARRGFAAGVLLLVAAACGGDATTPDAGVRAPITISAVLTSAQQASIAGMSVEVTGPGITTPIIATLDVAGASVNGTVQVPVGSSRTFTVRAFDAQGNQTYDGSATATVVAGTNPPLVVRMAALEGSVPINVTIATYGVTLTPSTASVAMNGDVTLTANATTDGATAPGPLTWGVVNPALVTLTVAGDGRSAVVRGRLEGSTRVVASYEGVAAASTITIGPAANQPPIARVNGPYTGVAGNSILFSSAGSSDADGSIVSYAWNFGDGTSSAEANPVKTYPVAGTYAVTLTVADDRGATASASTSATVSVANQLPVVGGIGHPGSIYVGVPVTFTAMASDPDGTVVEYRWVFSNLITQYTTTTNTLTVTFSTVGPAAVAVGVVDNRGAPSASPSRTSSFTVQAAPPPSGFALASIYAGSSHSCGLTSAGRAYCWGAGGVGQLGTGGTTVSATRPLAVAMTGLTITKLALGLSFSCGLATTGTLYCWGTNGEGQLGIGSTTDQLSPTPVPGGTFTDVVGSDVNACGLRAGTWYCWGRNDAAQTGQPQATARVLSPTPAPTVAGETWTSLALGLGHTCALSSTGAVFCWGNNSRGQLGSPTAVSGPTPVRVDFPGTTPPILSRIVAGHSYTCALEAPTNAMWCWGENTRGQQAIPVSGPTTPHRVAGDFSGLVAGSSFACAVGRSVCWGDNDFGELGSGTATATPRHTPAVVAGGAMQAIAPGIDNHMCGIRGGLALCWGRNGAGQLGDGTSTDRPAPTAVLTP